MARKRRIRSPHPGVKLKRRKLSSGAVSWRAHYVDPETDREVAVTLDPLALPTKEARTRWAQNLARDLAQRRMQTAAGQTPRPAATEIEAAVDAYLEAARARLQPKTIKTYAGAYARLLEWAAAARVRTTRDLTPARLAGLRDHLIALPKRGAEPGGRRGARVALDDRRSPVSVNRELRAIKTLLSAWRKRGLVPALHRDDIADALTSLPVDREQPSYLRPAQIRRLLEAAARHDAAVYSTTRDELAGRRRRGSTPRYQPIAPFLAFVLLTGARRGEALTVSWAEVELDALDHQGRAVGEIRLEAATTKTRRARTIGLEVSPALRTVLKAWKLRTGGRGRVWGAYSPGVVDAARKRLVSEYGAPAFTWQALRSTCATYLTNAPGIFGAATVYMSARQLGHSVAVAERHYLGVHRGIPRDARTLEAAMQIEDELAELLERVQPAGPRAATP